MRRSVLLAAAALALFLLSFVGLNLFDSRPAAARPAAPPPAPDLRPDNGFLLVWGFAEPPGTDPLAPPYRERLRELFAARPRAPLLRSPYAQWLARLNDDYRLHWRGAAFHFPRPGEEDLCAYAASRRADLEERRERMAVPLLRYGRVLQAAALEDFTPLGWDVPTRSLLLATQAARLFAASRALAALDGEWQAAEEGLLAALEAGFRLIGAGRTLAVNSLGKTMVELSLQALASLLNRPDCPPASARLISGRLPRRPAAAFGTAAVRDFSLRSFSLALQRVKEEGFVDPYLLRNHFRNPAALFALERFVAISGPRLYTAAHALAAFFVKENETVAMMGAFWARVGALEEEPPWAWRGTPLGMRRSFGAAEGPFWWLRNPMGKMMVHSAVPYGWPILQHYVYRSHALRARYELTRLLALARLAAGAAGELGQAELRRLLAGPGGIDPFSGRPYRFGRERRVLYSLGSDRDDDQGREQQGGWRDSDIAVPIAFVKEDRR